MRVSIKHLWKDAQATGALGEENQEFGEHGALSMPFLCGDSLGLSSYLLGWLAIKNNNSNYYNLDATSCCIAFLKSFQIQNQQKLLVCSVTFLHAAIFDLVVDLCMKN